MKKRIAMLGATLSLACAPQGGLAATFGPDAVQTSSLTLRVDPVGSFVSSLAGVPGVPNNFASPVALKTNRLLGIDQYGTIQQAKTNGRTNTLFTTANAPDGLILNDREAVLNVAPGKRGNKVYVAFTSDNLPDFVDPDNPGDFVVRRLPAPLPGDVSAQFINPNEVTKPVADLYRLTPDDLSGFPPFIPNFTGVKYQVIYEYSVNNNSLTSPKALAAFEVQSSVTGHHGGGMVVTPDGDILFATGDNLPFGTNGRDAPQDDAEHVSKMFLIDPDSGSVELVAKGLRNTQRLDIFARDGENYVGFADIGGVTAEELNIVRLSDLLDTSVVENFGWGISGGTGREGTFYVSDGIPGILGTQPPATGEAPTGEAGFVQPHAQYGREGLPGGTRDFVAATGPVVSDTSFNSISVLFGDLALGDLFATLAPLNSIAADVFLVNLIDMFGNPTSLLELAGGVRADARFFNFGDGSAGVLLETTGAFYRLTEVAPISARVAHISSLSAVPSPVPLPASLLLLVSGVVLLAGARALRRGNRGM